MKTEHYDIDENIIESDTCENWHHSVLFDSKDRVLRRNDRLGTLLYHYCENGKALVKLDADGKWVWTTVYDEDQKVVLSKTPSRVDWLGGLRARYFDEDRRCVYASDDWAWVDFCDEMGKVHRSVNKVSGYWEDITYIGNGPAIEIFSNGKVIVNNYSHQDHHTVCVKSDGYWLETFYDPAHTTWRSESSKAGKLRHKLDEKGDIVKV